MSVVDLSLINLVIAPVPDGVNPIAALQTANNTVFKGAVAAAGTWVNEAAAGWTVDKYDIGKYQIYHYQSTLKYTVNTVGGASKVNSIVLNDTYFEIHTKDVNGNHIDADFSFAVAFY